MAFKKEKEAFPEDILDGSAEKVAVAKQKAASKAAKQDKKGAGAKKATVKKAKKKRMSPKQYFKNTIAELKRVNWPTRKELVSYTAAVIVFVLIIGVVVFLIDLGLLQGFNAIT